MDSCNFTGSMESSSGGDDHEYTSHPPAATEVPTADILHLLMNSSSGLLPLMHNHEYNPPLPVLEALPNSFDQINRPGSTDCHHQSLLFQLGAVLSGDELSVMMPPPAPQVPGNLGYRPSQIKRSDGLTGCLQNLTIPPVSYPPKLLHERSERRNSNDAPPARRKQKKRTRASRRPPTTVLTTDTSNFRAMVEEFTGIPSPPSAHLDHFGGNFARSTTVLSSSQFHSPSYVLRPSAQRLFQGAPPPTTLFVPATMSSNNTGISASTKLFFPLLSNKDNNIDSAPTATTSLSSLLDFGQILTKHTSGHNSKRAKQEQHRCPGGNLEQRGVNRHVPEEFGLSQP